MPQEELSHLTADLANNISHLARAVTDEPGQAPGEKALHAV